jgi:hypothetical protein
MLRAKPRYDARLVLVDLLHLEQVEAELLDALDEPVQLRLVADASP